jgi:Tol biopolymer transport system component
MKVPIEGGTAEKITGLEPSDGDLRPSLSSNGKYIAYAASIKGKAETAAKTFIRVVEFADGKAGRKILEKEVPLYGRIRWTPASDAISYEGERFNLFKLKLSDQMETQLTTFDQNIDSGDFLWSQDGKKILLFRVSTINNLVLIKDVASDKN